ncbi:metallophosphoesterase [Urbifossiella limnaea]|uniref:Putative metallophosphoesterase n=1 Tax=Urbifossiella limnaea TaxID=2528023 RepID=A0A517XYI7_9BACT|nr:metallophosphoesterase [Urbifossiella limnaea]QDU22562.1 putative metallophosphoesterase [Urbifossiella limnaea]
MGKQVLLWAAFLVAWVGHACVLTALLNNAYGRPFPKAFLKPLRLVTGAVILAFPLLNLATADALGPAFDAVVAYYGVCLVFGGVVFPVITAVRLLRARPGALVSETTHTLDVRADLGPAVVGDGKWRRVATLLLNDVFRVDFTDWTLAVPELPPAWEGLTVLLLSDLHFHGTPSRAFFERVLAEVRTRWPTPDVVCLGGDYVDTDTHHTWIAPLLGGVSATEGKFAILGNHDDHHRPEALRAELEAAGYTVVSNRWREVTVRGVPTVLVGHEGPWFGPPPDLSGAPAGLFRWCLSHTPDNVYWGGANGVRLMLSGHVHGGQIRLPVVGSIFVPSVYGRRFDAGVFQAGRTVLAVGRGLSGKEPLRFRCRPQVVRITLTTAERAG